MKEIWKDIPNYEIARIYNIGIPLVSKIRSGKLWSHI